MSPLTIVAPLVTLLIVWSMVQGMLTVPPCVTEDASNCYWDAQRMGNGLGTSFIAGDN